MLILREIIFWSWWYYSDFASFYKTTFNKNHFLLFQVCFEFFFGKSLLGLTTGDPTLSYRFAAWICCYAFSKQTMQCIFSNDVIGSILINTSKLGGDNKSNQLFANWCRFVKWNVITLANDETEQDQFDYDAARGFFIPREHSKYLDRERYHTWANVNKVMGWGSVIVLTRFDVTIYWVRTKPHDITAGQQNQSNYYN